MTMLMKTKNTKEEEEEVEDTSSTSKHLLNLPSHHHTTSTSTSSSDDDSTVTNLRTVDEILLNHSYSSSSSDDDAHVDDHHLSPSFKSPILTSSASQSRFTTTSSTRPAESSSSSSATAGEFLLGLRTRTRTNTTTLPPHLLFGTAGRSAKPGAALAAAAAASRRVPTHAAALILSRTASASILPSSTAATTSSTSNYDRQLDTSAPISRALSTGFQINHVSSQISPSTSDGTKLVLSEPADVEPDERWDSYQSAALVPEQEVTTLETSLARGAIFDSGYAPTEDEEAAAKLEEPEQEFFSTSDIGPHEASPLNLDEHTTRAHSSLTEEDDASIVDDASDKEISPSLDSDDKGGDVVDDLGVTNSERPELDDQYKPTSTTTDSETVADNEFLDLAENIINQLEHKAVAKMAEKKTISPPRKPLELAEELEKKHAFSGLDWKNDIASQPMKLEGVRRGSIALGYFDVSASNTITRTVSSQLFRRDQGSPLSIAVHFNFIAVGLSKGLVLVVPSKYSPHSADSMDAKMLMLGIQGDNTHPAVTSMCFNQPGDLLFAGYSDGRIVVWDLQKGVAVKVVTGIHDAPVVHLLYLGQDSQVTRQYRVVSGDSKGLVWLITFTVVPWLNRFSFSNTCLLDGQNTGKALCASPLLPDEFCGGSLMSAQQSNTSGSSSSSIGSMVGGVLGGDAARKLSNEKSSAAEEGVVIFATYQSAMVARVSPSVVVYAQLSRPDGVREGSMPYTAWKSMGKQNGASTDISGEEAEKVSLLAIAWDRKVQVAKLVKSKLKVFAKWTIESSAIGVAWLDDEMLVILTSNGQLCFFAKDGTLIHQTSFMVDGSGGDDVVAYHMHFTNVYGNPEKAFHNCIAVRGATIYVLGPSHLIVCRLLPWKERIQTLKKAGDWMGALNMAMSLFDGQAHGVIDLPRTVNAIQEAIMPYLVELLLSYVDEVFSYISVAFCNQIGKLEQLTNSQTEATTVHSEIKEQFSRVGGVAVEFCVHIKRTDVLFDEILSKFVAVQQRDAFLELLEPYILKDMLGSLPPEVMQALVEHYSTKGWLQRVEQCVLHMDISSLDFNQVVRLCREHRLYGALVYLFNRGLDDFKAPLEELLIVIQNEEREAAAALGYRMLVYLKYCFTGLAFPPGQGSLPAMRLPSLRFELVQFLLEASNAKNLGTVNNLSSPGSYLNIYHLLELDTDATLEVLRCAFAGNQSSTHKSPSNESENENLEGNQENDLMATDLDVMVQKVVDGLVHVLGRNTFETSEAWPSKSDIGHMLEFIAYYTSCKRAVIPSGVLSQILEYYTSDTNLPPSTSGRRVDILWKREKQMLALLEAVPQTDWDTSYVLQLCEKSQFFQVCGLIHAIHHRHIPALDSLMKDLHEPMHAFSFISDSLDKLSDTVAESFRSAVLSRIPDLIILSREDAYFLVSHHFSGECQNILSELRTHPKSLFLYLKTVFEIHLSGTLNFSRPSKDENLELPNGKARDQSIALYLRRTSGFSKFVRDNPVQITNEMIELYLQLLCQYECNSVLKFLKSVEPYRVEQCLRLCQDYGVKDATVFLLEKVGDVGSALQLMLSGIGENYAKLDAAIERVVSDASVEHYSTLLKVKEVNDIRDILHACVGLCQRNSPRLDAEESESYWFKLLDTFCEPLLGEFTGEANPNGDSHGGSLIESMRGQENNWTISKDHKGAQVSRKLFSHFIREIVEGMIGFVRLPIIMTKLLADNTGQEFGDFKLTILGMLGTYGFERRILDTAKSLIEDDTFYTMSLLKKGASRGYAPRSLVCCICNCLLTRNNSSSSGIHLFNCGHACHLHCEVTESDTSNRGPSSTGCPVCMPTKNGLMSEGRTTGLQENGLVSNPAPERRQQSHGIMSPYPHETDTTENSYGFSQISRFEMLASLKKEQRLIQVESIPPLRLAPPAVYHEKVEKRTTINLGESSNNAAGVKRTSKSTQLRDKKLRGSSIRLPLKANIFGKEKSSKR